MGNVDSLQYVLQGILGKLIRPPLRNALSSTKITPQRLGIKRYATDFTASAVSPAQNRIISGLETALFIAGMFPNDSASSEDLNPSPQSHHVTSYSQAKLHPALYLYSDANARRENRR